MERIKKLLRMLVGYPKRLFNGTSLRATVVDSKIDDKARIQHKASVKYSSVGKYTYISARSSVLYTNSTFSLYTEAWQIS